MFERINSLHFLITCQIKLKQFLCWEIFILWWIFIKGIVQLYFWNDDQNPLWAIDTFKNNKLSFQAKGRTFDYIFGDLTDTPITTKPRDQDCWVFLSNILEQGMSVLKPITGKYLTHCNGVNVPQSIHAYENVLAKICNGKVFYSKTKSYVKSFFETWVFYQLSRRDWKHFIH